MKNYFFALLAITFFTYHGCSSGQTPSPYNLTATEFAGKIKTLPNAPVLDVRTPGEFSNGHLVNALNADWNGNDFQKQISTLDKSKPVFVYCQSGRRSAAAASHMRSDGFKEVYELNGGIMKWRAENLPETTSSATKTGMSRQQFDALTSGKSVLIDFYADWCAPCKLMKPYIDEIAKNKTAQVVVIRINADDNQALCKELKIDALPVLQLYKNKSLTWSHTGFISKEDLLKQLASH